MKRIVCKTTCASKGLEVTLRHKRAHKNSDVLSMPRRTQRILQNVELWPNSIRVATGQTRIYKKTSSTGKELKNFSAETSFHCQRVHQKDQQKEIFTSILDRFQNNWVFRAMPLRNNENETTRAIICMNKEAGQNPQIKSRRSNCRDDLREARMAKNDLTQLERVHTKASSKIKRKACFGKPRSLHLLWLMESQPVEQIRVGKSKMDTGWWSLRNFFGWGFLGFRTHVVATGVHTLTCCTLFCT